MTETIKETGGLIECKYSCSLCGLHRVICRVDARKPDQKIDEWMDNLTAALSADHRKRSPGCNPRTLSEVLIPTTDGPLGSMSS
jgi:hypothetical protein